VKRDDDDDDDRPMPWGGDFSTGHDSYKEPYRVPPEGVAGMRTLDEW